MKEFLTGVNYFGQGVKMLLHPGIKRFVIIPIVLNALLVGGLSWYAIDVIGRLSAGLIAYLPSFFSWLYWLIMPLLLLVVLLSLAYFFSTLLMLIMAPVNSFLSEKISKIKGQPLAPEPMLSLLRRTFKRELIKLGYLLPRYLALFVISLIPVVNVISSILWLAFACWVISLQYADYGFDNQQLEFSTTRQHMRQHWQQAFGFGLVVTVLFSVPIVNWLMMPAAVIGATLMSHSNTLAASKESQNRLS